MTSITQKRRYLPHQISTKQHAVELYRAEKDIDYVLRSYHISKASLMRWNKQYDGTRESLVPKSHRPHTRHPNAHTEQELKWIRDLHRRNPNISMGEMYGKLLERGYTRSAESLYRIFVRMGYRQKVESTKKKSRHLGHYDTPTVLGIKWQMDVKYVPKICYTGSDGQKFYQYTMLEEASRERFLYVYEEQSSYSTVDFVMRAIRYFGYQPKIIQTDNGSEFTHFKRTDRTHPFDLLCQDLGIEHKRIRPRTPWHNGKVERSHRNDQERFYNHLKFYSYEDLQKQLRSYMYRSNRIPMRVLGWRSPRQMREALEAAPEFTASSRAAPSFQQ